MSFISFDYKCLQSGEIVSKFIKKIDMNDQTCRCGAPMVKLPPGTKTHFRFADTKLKG